MASIQASGYPLVFPTSPQSAVERGTGGFRFAGRSLEGMQKEGVVLHAASLTAWRMVSDEGPYLNGTDLAPFPLAFFTAGMAFSFMSSVREAAAALGIGFRRAHLSLDNVYSMDGSFLRGDAIGGARSPELSLSVAGVQGDSEALMIEALGRCPALALMADPMENSFALQHNGRKATLSGLRQSAAHREDPLDYLADVAPEKGGFLPDIITKMESAEIVEGVEGGAGSSLQASQKRMLHVHGEADAPYRGTMDVRVSLRKPIGSSFCFRSDDGSTDAGVAPPPLAFLVAGIGFCFMTQLGRYAQIVKQDLKGYRIVQDNPVYEEAGRTRLGPFDTGVFLDMAEDATAGEKLVTVGERTCFLHASMRGAHPARVGLGPG